MTQFQVQTHSHSSLPLLLAPHPTPRTMYSKPRSPSSPLTHSTITFPASLLMYLFLLLFLVCLPFTAHACSDPNDVNCQICPSSSRGNSISGFPRVTSAGHSTSSDLGHFTWLACNGTGGGCASYLAPLDPSYSPVADHASPDNYVQSLLAYTTFAVAAALVAAVACAVFGVLRCAVRRQEGGGAGGRYPTPASTSPYSLGYGHSAKSGELQYSGRQRWAARAWMWLSVALLLVWVAVGWYEGGRHVQSDAQAFIASPQPLVQQLQSTQPAVAALVSGMAEDVLAGTVTNVTAALNGAVDLPGLVAGLGVAEAVLGALPSVRPVQAALLQLQANTSALGASITAALPAYSATFANVTNLTALVTAMSASLATYQSLTTQLTADLPLAQTYTAALINWSQYNYNPATGSGYVDTVEQYLLDYSALPSPATVNSLARSVQLVLGLGSGVAMNGTEAAALFQGVLQMYVALEQVPPFQSASQLMVSINNFINVSVTYGQATSTSQYLNQSDALIGQLLPLLATIRAQYTQLQPFLNATLPIAAGVQMLQSMQASLAQLPSAAQLQAADGVLPTLQSVVANLTTVLQPLNAFTSNFLSLPSSSLLLAYQAELNGTVPAAQAQFTQTVAQLQALLAVAASVNTAPDVASLQQLSSVNTQLPLLRNSSFVGSLTQLNASLASLRLSQYVPPVNALQSVYVSTLAYATPQLTGAYYQLGSLVNNVVNNISQGTVTADLNAFTGGYCDNTGSGCSANQLCPSGGNCIGQGVKRCAVTQSIPCNYSAQCPSGDRCLIDGNVYARILSSLQAFWTVAPSQNATTALVGLYSSVESAIRAARLSTINALLPPATTNVGNNAALAAPLAANLSAVQAALAGYNGSSVAAEYAPVLGALAATNVTAALGAVSGVNATLVAIAASNATAQLADVSATLATLSAFLYTAYPAAYAPRLTPAALATAYTGDEAAGNLTAYVAQTLTGIAQYLAATPGLAALGTDAVAGSGGVQAWLHQLYSPALSRPGAFYYLASLYTFAFADPASLTPPTAPSYTVTLGPDGQAYDNATYCLTDACLHSSVDYYWTRDVSETTQWNVRLAPSDIAGPLLLLPFFLALLGLACTLLCWSYKWSHAVALATAVVVFLLVPLVFVVAGFVFPLALLQGDVCRGGGNAVYDAMLARQDTVCTEWLGGVGTAEACTIRTFNLSATLNVRAVVYEVASGQCGAQYDDALDQAFASLRQSAAAYPPAQVAALTAALATNASIVVQPELLSILDASAGVATQQLDAFLGSLQSTLSCSSLNAQLVAVQASFCCSLTSSLFWSASAWFLIAFTLCCCEGPAAVFGSKRFSERLVGGKIAPGVLYDPHGQYQQQVHSGVGAEKAAKLALITDSEGGVIELVKNRKYTDSLLRGVHDKGDTTPPSATSGKSLDQCPICLQDVMLLSTMAACGHRVCRQCARGYVQSELAKRGHPILCPLSQLKRNARPACERPMADEDVMDGMSDEQRNHYMLLKSLSASIAPTTAPSSPAHSPADAEEKTQPPPPLSAGMRDRNRPLPQSARRAVGGGGHTPNVHAFISTPGGSFSVLQHPMSHYAQTGQAAPDNAAMTRTGGGLYGTAGPMTGVSGGGSGASLGRTRDVGFDPRLYNRTSHGHTTAHTRAGLAHQCPQPGCAGQAVQRADGDVLAVCPACGYRWCVQCDVPWHDGATCAQAAQARRRALEWEVEMAMAQQQMMQQQRRVPPHWGTGGTGVGLDSHGGGGGMANVEEGNEES